MFQMLFFCGIGGVQKNVGYGKRLYSLLAMAAKIDVSRKKLQNSKFLIIQPHSQNHDNPCEIVTVS